MSLALKLYRLQQIDQKIQENQTRIQNIDHILEDNLLVRQAEQDVEEREKILHRAKQKLREAEWNVQAQRNKIDQTETKLYSGKVNNPKELQDLQNELAALKRYLSVLEDRQLEAMLSLDEVEKDYQKAQNNMRKVLENFDEQRIILTAERSDLIQDLRHLEEERRAASSTIPTEDLTLYEELRTQKLGVSVAKVNNRACTACGSTLTAASYQAARSPSKLTRCDSCGRILYAA